MDKVILWDFDGTLAYRKDMWSGALLGVLDQEEPGHDITMDDLRKGIRDGFPWHRPERPHPELSDPKAWWEAIESLMASGYQSAGIEPARAAKFARLAHLRYADPAGYTLFDDTLPVLNRLAERDWKHVILSNHVPELQAIVNGIGLGGVISRVVTSALIGFEKPHAGAFDAALRAAGHPETRWMVGDNPDADVRGAEAMGIPAILVRTKQDTVERSAPDLHGVADILGA